VNNHRHRPPMGLRPPQEVLRRLLLT
jgi:hypothetical protein